MVKLKLGVIESDCRREFTIFMIPSLYYRAFVLLCLSLVYRLVYERCAF